ARRESYRAENLPKWKAERELIEAQMERYGSPATSDRAAYGGQSHPSIRRKQLQSLSDTNVQRMAQLSQRWQRLTELIGDKSMATPCYRDDYVTLCHGDAFEVIPSLPEDIGCLLTAPPYFQVKDDEWDNQWDKASDFLAWMGEWLDLAKPKLAPNCSVWVFASPAMTSSVERLVAERFRPLNSIRWVTEAGWHNKAELSAMRRSLTPWEGIIFAEQYD